jgi:hypothetical protein
MHVRLVGLAARNTPLVLPQFSRAASPHIARFGEVLPCHFQAALKCCITREEVLPCHFQAALKCCITRETERARRSRWGRRVSDADRSSPNTSFTDPECLSGVFPTQKSKDPSEASLGSCTHVIRHERLWAGGLKAPDIR